MCVEWSCYMISGSKWVLTMRWSIYHRKHQQKQSKNILVGVSVCMCSFVCAVSKTSHDLLAVSQFWLQPKYAMARGGHTILSFSRLHK